MINLQPEDLITVQEALLAGADSKMLGAVHVLHMTCVEVVKTAKIDLAKLLDMSYVMTEVPDFREKLAKNLQKFSAHYPEFSTERMIEGMKKMMEGFDFTDLSERLKNMRLEIPE